MMIKMGLARRTGEDLFWLEGRFALNEAILPHTERGQVPARRTKPVRPTPNEARTPRRTKPVRAAPNEATGKMGKAPNEAKLDGRAPNEAVGKIGKAPNEAIAFRAPNEALAPNEATAPNEPDGSRFAVPCAESMAP
jgi:hypothetical protein